MFSKTIISIFFVFAALFLRASQVDSLYNLLDTAKGKSRLDILNAIGAEHLDRSNYEKALECYLENIKLSRELGELRAQARAMGNLGIVYSKIGNYDKALEYNKASIAIWDEAKDRLNQSKVLNSIGVIYAEKKNFPKAIEYFEQAVNLKKEAGITDALATTLSNLCNCYKDMADYQKALDYCLDGLSVAKNQNEVKSISHGYNNLGETYSELGQYSMAIAYFDSALNISLTNGFKNHSMHAYKGLFELYKTTNDPAKALEYHILYQQMKDSIFNKSNNLRITNLQTKFETENKEKENMILKKESEARKFKQYALAAILFLALVLIVALFFNQTNYKKRKQEENEKLLNELKLLKAELKVKHGDSLQEQKVGINIEKVTQLSEGKLNATDWKILNLIYQNPIATNQEIANEVFLSVPGVKSSLKKMYTLLDIDDSTPNKKLSLVIKIVKISTE